jgi:mycothiol synthase
MIRRAEADADLEAWVRVWNAITPDDTTTVEQQRERQERRPNRLWVVAERDGEVVACGFAGPSDTPGRAFVSPRVLPEVRRQGLGSALLRELVRHAETLDSDTVSAHVDGNDAGSLAFAHRFGFEEGDRQVEQVLRVRDASQPQVPPGVRFLTVAERPQLLREAYGLAQDGYADLATTDPVVVTLDEWLDDEATLPEGSFVALADGEIVGYSGLCRHPSDPTTAWDGLTVVRREWRRRGLATALKQAEIAWAAENGIDEIVTWTQRGNEAMRALNERLGYVYRAVVVSVRAPLPLRV